MHISRIQVPKFRALKDVDISFEKDFDPRIFPLASQNGGGKSTLLQLVFCLLHCSAHPESISFINNILSDFSLDDDFQEGKIMSIDFVDLQFSENEIKLDFCLLSEEKFHTKFTEWLTYENKNIPQFDEDDNSIFDFSYYSVIDDFYKSIMTYEDKSQLVENYVQVIDFLLQYLSEEENRQKNRSDLFGVKDVMAIRSEAIHFQRLILEIDKVLVDNFQRSEGFFSLPNNTIKKRYSTLRKHLSFFIDQYEFSRANNSYYISCCDIKGKNYILHCHSNNSEVIPFYFLLKISSKIHFLSSASQVFLFLNRNERKLLFKKQVSNGTYFSALNQAKQNLPNFYLHDFIPIDELLKSFEIARDQDFKKVTTTGMYGNTYNQLVEEITTIIPGKKARPEYDLSKIYFSKIDEDNQELCPEDLSHGELRRLGLYLWLKNQNIQDSIILIDELEIGLHPDWQYQIIQDLIKHFSNNQYIIATHSYDVCEALTPAHVKELPPKLTMQSGI